MENVHWWVILSDGTHAIEHVGQWREIPGERKPWVRLTQFVAEKGLFIEDLTLTVNNHYVHLPQRFARFDMNKAFISPDYYSLQYHFEVDDIFGAQNEGRFIDLVAHYSGIDINEDIALHLIFDIAEGNNHWIILTRGDEALAPSPAQRPVTFDIMRV